jgi:YegS/Rv2252/BmrU family lipid kinase
VTDRSTFLLVNPAAGRGRGARRKGLYESLLRARIGDFDSAVSERPGHEVELLDRALERGYKNILALGGDGTWSVAADRIIRSSRQDVALGLLPAGTGCDFAKTFGLAWAEPERAVEAIAGGRRRRIDVGRVEGRHFLNIVGFGFDIAVIDDAARMPLLQGDLLYKFCALRQLFSFPGLPLALVGGDGAREVDALMLVVANARYFGGSFHIAPNARLDDGRLDAVCILDAGPLTRARLFQLVARGAHVGHERVKVEQGASFEVKFAQPVRYEVDGEVHRSQGSVLRIESVPRALDVLVPADA